MYVVSVEVKSRVFPRAERLYRSHEIEQVARFGRRFTTPHLRVYYDLPGEKSGKSVNRATGQRARVTVVVSKKTAKGAVTRNRLKRRVRAALKSLTLPKGARVIVFPNLKVLDLPFDILVEDLNRWLTKVTPPDQTTSTR